MLVTREIPSVIRGGCRLVAWECTCDCGVICSVLAGNLTTGHSNSCGCYRKETKTKHQLCDHKMYRVYHNMLIRCTDEKSKDFTKYGGRGITVCERWRENFINFFEDMSPTYVVGLTLDRINVNGNYEPSNCRWVTVQQNNMNTRGNINASSKYKGVSFHKSASKWQASIKKDGRQRYLGLFPTEKQAALAYNISAKELFAEFAHLNDLGD